MKNVSIVLFVISAALSGCATSQGEAKDLEALPDKLRFALLETKRDSELCNAYNNPAIKANTSIQIEQILRDRKISQCTALGKVRSIPAMNDTRAGDAVASQMQTDSLKETKAVENEPVGPPSRFDILGIRPGVSTERDVLAQARANLGKNGDSMLYRFEIGGFQMPCGVQYERGRVAAFICFTGKKHSGESNIHSHEILVKGFAEKFGTPTRSEKVAVTNGFGAAFSNNRVTWEDASGAWVQLNSISETIDQGSLSLFSAENIRRKLKAAEAEDAKRKF